MLKQFGFDVSFTTYRAVRHRVVCFILLVIVLDVGSGSSVGIGTELRCC